MGRRSLAVMLLTLLLAGFALAAAAAAPPHGNAGAVFQFDQSEFPGAKPWTAKPFLDNPNDFQFVVIGDRTGGANPRGTFSIAMDQINMLQPEFVINVGDMIEGYTTKRDELNAEWDEAEGVVGKLQMRFFFVRGNHDVNLPVSREVWRERFGPGYYHFVYKNALFVVLDTEDAERSLPPNMEEDIETYNRLKREDPEAARNWLKQWLSTPEAVEAFGHGAQVKFPETQVAWLRKTLAENADVRWTFVFLHEPVWDNPSEGFKEIQALLKGRKHTVFAGHVHYYDYDNIDGVEYITMGPAGAAFLGQEGPGNVDHLMWVTMTEEGPQMANIALKGIFDRKGLDPSLFGAYDRAGGPEARSAGQTGSEAKPGGGGATPPPGQSLGIASVPNLRDLGGYQTTGGATVARGLVYRSDQLSGISPADMRKLAALGLKNVYDLRTAAEREARPDELPPGANSVWLDVLADSPQAGPAQVEKLVHNPKEANAVLGGGKAEEGFMQAYREFVSLPSARSGFRRLFLALSDKKQLPALFHCTTGKDRTGWAAAALLTLLGVPRDQVMEDYLRSNDYILPAYQKAIDAFVAGGGERSIAVAILGVREEYLNAAFDEMQQRYGTVENYFTDGLGIGPAQQQALRATLLEP
jgi:protein-tyrosine phosphatase